MSLRLRAEHGEHRRRRRDVIAVVRAEHLNLVEAHAVVDVLAVMVAQPAVHGRGLTRRRRDRRKQTTAIRISAK